MLLIIVVRKSNVARRAKLWIIIWWSLTKIFLGLDWKSKMATAAEQIQYRSLWKHLTIWLQTWIDVLFMILPHISGFFLSIVNSRWSSNLNRTKFIWKWKLDWNQLINIWSFSKFSFFCVCVWIGNSRLSTPKDTKVLR